MHQKLCLVLISGRYYFYIIFIYKHWRCCRISKGYSSNSSNVTISDTSISLKLHRRSTIPDQLRIGSKSRKCSKMIERIQRVRQLRRFDIERTQKNPRGKLIDISSILKVESTLKFPRRIDVIISTWIRLSKSMKSRRTFNVEFRRPIDRRRCVHWVVIKIVPFYYR